MNEKVIRLIERLNSNDDELHRHDTRLRNLEGFRSGTEQQIKNLIEQIESLVATIKWLLATTVITLVGFFIWYIQSL